MPQEKTTFRQFCTDALGDAHAINPTETPSGSKLDVTRRKFGNMAQNWSANRLRLFYVPEVAYTLIGGLGVYEIGPGAAQYDTDSGNFTKPVMVQSGVVIVGNARRWPLNLCTRPQWQNNQQRAQTDPDGPLDFFYDANEPIATFNVAPKPFGPTTMYLDQWNPLRGFDVSEIDDFIDDFYPPRYILAMRKALAVELAATYQLAADQVLISEMQTAIQAIENVNNETLSGSFGTSRTLAGPIKGDGSSVQAQPQQ